MSMQITYLTTEMIDGTVHDRVRVTAADRIKLERAGRNRNWQVGNSESTYVTTQLYFLAWAGLIRTGALGPELTFEDFVNHQLVDVHSERAEAELGETELGNPTAPAPTAG